MQLDELGNGNYFCDFEVFRGVEVQYNAIATTPADILTITEYDLRATLSKNVF
jgi:hypothetical protein